MHAVRFNLAFSTGLQLYSFLFACSGAHPQGCSGLLAGFGRNIERVSGHADGRDQACLQRIQTFIYFHFLWNALVHVPKAVQVSWRVSAETLVPRHAYGLDHSCSQRIQAFRRFHVKVVVHVSKSAQVSLRASTETLDTQ
jgi:hypothetical protein